MALGSWLSVIWHKAGGPIAAAAAVAAGQPELASAAYAAGSAVSAKKPSAPTVQPPLAVGPGTQGGFVAAYETLPPADKEIITIGGAVLGALLLARILAPGGRR